MTKSEAPQPDEIVQRKLGPSSPTMMRRHSKWKTRKNGGSLLRPLSCTFPGFCPPTSITKSVNAKSHDLRGEGHENPTSRIFGLNS